MSHDRCPACDHLTAPCSACFARLAGAVTRAPLRDAVDAAELSGALARLAAAGGALILPPAALTEIVTLAEGDPRR